MDGLGVASTDSATTGVVDVVVLLTVTERQVVRGANIKRVVRHVLHGTPLAFDVITLGVVAFLLDCSTRIGFDVIAIIASARKDVQAVLLLVVQLLGVTRKLGRGRVSKRKARGIRGGTYEELVCPQPGLVTYHRPASNCQSVATYQDAEC